MGESDRPKPIIKIKSVEPAIPENTRYRLVMVDGEFIRINLQERIIINHRTLLRREAKKGLGKQPDMVTLKSNDPTIYDKSVLKNLRLAIESSKSNPKPQTPTKLFRKLAIQYHPDLYSNEPKAVLKLAEEYTRTLLALRNNGEFDW